MIGSDDGPGISFHDFNGTCTSSVVFTEAALTATVLRKDIESQRKKNRLE